MKVLIYYFSGTGNTKMVLDRFVQHFTERGVQTVVKNIDDYYDSKNECNKKTESINNYENHIDSENEYINQTDNIDKYNKQIVDGDEIKKIDSGDEYNIQLENIDEYDKVGLFYPIHAFNAPANVLQFAKKLQKRKDKKPLFIVKTSGEPLALNNISSLKVKSILRKRGLILENEYHYCMPYNIIFRHTDNMAYKMWESAKSIIPYDCDEIIAGEKRKLKYIPCGRMLAWIFRIEHWAGRFNGKKYKVNENCIKCGMCVRNCPTHNITMENGNFKFGKNCLMCMRCSFNCPKNCIKIGLFENWKVNGRYSFTPNKNQVETHKNYCKRSYKKYFSKIENRLNSIDAKSNTQ